MPDYFTVQPETQKGNVYATEFSYTASLPNIYKTFTWDFGNGVFDYNKKSTSVVYNYPGLYTVGLSAWDDEGNIFSESTDVNVDYVYRDAIQYLKIPSEYGIPGIRSAEPFTLALTSAKLNEPLSIVLQAYGSYSVPDYVVPDKWKFITPTWKFINADTDEILSGVLPLTTTPIYHDNKIVAVSGTASFYYVDDLATGTDLETTCPLLMVTTLCSERFSYPPESLIYPYYSYSNSEVSRAVVAWQINDVIPTNLKVSENYINEIYPLKWANVPIPVMTSCVFNPALTKEYRNSPNAELTDALSYPRTNKFGKANSVRFALSAVGGDLIPESHYTVETFDGASYHPLSAPVHFQAFDEYNNAASGYIFNTITALAPLSSTVVLAVSTTAINKADDDGSFTFPVGYPIYPHVYISHPYENNINRVQLNTFAPECEAIKFYKKQGVLVEGSASFIHTQPLTSWDLATYEISGTAAVYGMAFDPITNMLYALDADQDLLHLYQRGTTLLSSISLSSYTNVEYNTPSYISVDIDGDLWVSMYGSSIVLKLSSDLSLMFVASAVKTPSYIIDGNTKQPLSAIGEEGYIVTLLSDEFEEPLNPPIIETDKNSDAWACYAYPTDSFLIKFDRYTGQELCRANTLSPSSVPVSLAINVNNDVWVACYASNSLELYSGSDGSLMQSVSGVIHPSYIAMDRSNNVWVTHGYNLCSVYNTSANEFTHFRFFSEGKYFEQTDGYTDLDIKLATEENEIWGGLAVDVFNRVWVVDSEKNNTFIFSAKRPLEISNTYKVIPTANRHYVILGGTNYVTEVFDYRVRSAQAAGDWTGNRWYQKYSGAYNAVNIKGFSAPFSIYGLDESFKLAKVNETFDMAAHMKSLALPEALYLNPEMFDTFLPGVLGNEDPTKEGLGRQTYERIANFTQTHADVETAEIEQLISFATQLSVSSKRYGVEFPAEVKRLLDLFSVPKHKLRGLVSFETDFNKNVGAIIYPWQTISSGQTLVAKDRNFEESRLVHVSPLSSTSGVLDIYPLSAIELNGLRKPIFDNYYFFNYEVGQIGYTNNIIDWDSSHTTFSYNLSTYEQWYGDDGIIETMFNNLLTKKLFS
jgi:hypothetical protein